MSTWKLPGPATVDLRSPAATARWPVKAAGDRAGARGYRAVTHESPTP